MSDSLATFPHFIFTTFVSFSIIVHPKVRVSFNKNKRNEKVGAVLDAIAKAKVFQFLSFLHLHVEIQKKTSNGGANKEAKVYCPFFNAIMIYEPVSLFIFLFLCIHWLRNNEQGGLAMF